MKVRMKTNIERPFNANKFNTTALSEVIGYGDEFGSDSFFIEDLDVLIEAKDSNGKQIGWKDMGQAFRDKDLIIDNYNTYFFEPETKEDRERGYTL